MSRSQVRVPSQAPKSKAPQAAIIRGLRGFAFFIFACMLCSKQGFFAHFFANMGVKNFFYP